MAKKLTRIEQVMTLVKEQIAARYYLPGHRLPSVRIQAQKLGYSVSTVVEAYERLVAEGVLESKAGSGFFVAGAVAPLVLTNLAPQLDREVDPLWISRQGLENNDHPLRPGCGWLPESWMFDQGMRRAMRQVAKLPASELVEYASPLGLSSLRLWIGRRMAGFGLEVSPNTIMLTESGTHAIDLLCRFFLQAGDTVMVDDPCYFNFHALLKAHRVQVVGVPYGATGPDLAVFEQLLKQHQPRLYITNSGLQNPTGGVLSATVAHRLLSLAKASDLLIVEDDVFADFEHSAAPRLSVFDGLEQVISIGSFSKTISASVRCGYIITKPEWIDALVDLKIATSFGGGRLASELTHFALTDSGYRKHMEAVRLHLQQCMHTVIPKLEALGFELAFRPMVGMFVWCRLPMAMDAAVLARMCLPKGVVLAPGNVFGLSAQSKHFMRCNVSQCTDERIFDVLKLAIEHYPHE